MEISKEAEPRAREYALAFGTASDQPPVATGGTEGVASRQFHALAFQPPPFRMQVVAKSCLGCTAIQREAICTRATKNPDAKKAPGFEKNGFARRL